MQTYTFHLKDRPFEQILAGTKKLECRLYDEKRKNIHIGNIFIFEKKTDSSEHITVEVISLHRYSTFNELFAHTHQEFFGVPFETLEDSMLEYYSKEDEEKYGVIGIAFKLIEK